MQTMYTLVGDAVQELLLPGADEYVLPGIRWGAFDDLFTPAYWRGQAHQHAQLGTYAQLKLGRTLVEEVAACLLGGYGMPAEIALAAFRSVREAALLERVVGQSEIEAVLLEPLQFGGKGRRYRFPRQKARYLSGCLGRLLTLKPADEDIAFRNQLADLPGIGLKTASWIVRNHRASNAVAIIDVHIFRAGRHMALFPLGSDAQRHYRELERLFLGFASAIQVPAALLDAMIWDYMRRLPETATDRPAQPRTQQEQLFSETRALQQPCFLSAYSTA